MSAATNPVTSPVPESPTPLASPQLPKKPRSYLWLILLGFVGLTGWLVYAIQHQQQVEQTAATTVAIRTVKAHSGTLTRRVRLAGQTSARKFVNITAPILRGPENRDSMILLKLAPSGSFIRKGEALASLDGQTIQDHIDDLNDTVEASQSDVVKQAATQVRMWESLQQTLRAARADVDKWKLDASAAETKTDLDRELLKLGVDEAQARYQQLQQDLGTTKLSHQAQLKVLQLTVERHKRHVGRHANDLKRFTVAAPMNGLVVMQSRFRGGEMQQIKEGDQVYPGLLFMRVVDTSTMQVEANINQAESGDFRLGQEAVVGLDAFPEIKLKGKVYSIGALATRSFRENYYIRNIPVRIQIEGTDPRLIPDLSAYAEIKLAQQDDAVIVPLSALKLENGKSYVEVKKGDQWERRQVKTALSNELEAAVTEGVNAGDELRVF